MFNNAKTTILGIRMYAMKILNITVISTVLSILAFIALGSTKMVLARYAKEITF